MHNMMPGILFANAEFLCNDLQVGYFETGNYTYSCILNPASNYMFNVNNRNSRTRCEIRPKLTIKAPE